MKNKRGFMTVYVCMFFLTLVSLLLLVIGGVRASTLQSNTAALSRLWGQSILAEYDLNLQKRYHLFGFYGYPALVKEKLYFYGQETFSQKKQVDWEVSACSLYDYSLRNVNVFQLQVIEAGKAVLAEDAVKTEETEKPDDRIVPVNGHTEGNRENLFDQLPSAGIKSGFQLSVLTALLEEEFSLGSILKKGSDQYVETTYIFSHFTHKLEEEKGDTYFDQEIEYIIGGKQSDASNAKTVRNRIIAVREALNLIYLNENERTRNEALAIAEVLTPGAAAVATQQALLAAWALAESINDYRLLLAGHRIPLQKTTSTWATDLESVMANETDGYIYTGTDAGDGYEDYLRFFVYMVDERVRLLRMMDLIQINMRWFYYGDFLLSDYYGGLRFTLTVDGKAHDVEMCYEQEE